MSKTHAKDLGPSEVHGRAIGFARSLMVGDYNKLVLDPRIQNAIMAVQAALGTQLDELPEDYNVVEVGVTMISQLVCVVASATVGSAVDVAGGNICKEDECLAVHRATIALGIGYLSATALQGDVVQPDNLGMN